MNDFIEDKQKKQTNKQTKTKQNKTKSKLKDIYFIILIIINFTDLILNS